jgi:hypothetical protein
MSARDLAQETFVRLREESLPLVLGTRWEYVPAEPGADFDALVVEWLTRVDDGGRWYLAHTTFSNRHKK